MFTQVTFKQDEYAQPIIQKMNMHNPLETHASLKKPHTTDLQPGYHHSITENLSWYGILGRKVDTSLCVWEGMKKINRVILCN